MSNIFKFQQSTGIISLGGNVAVGRNYTGLPGVVNGVIVEGNVGIGTSRTVQSLHVGIGSIGVDSMIPSKVVVTNASKVLESSAVTTVELGYLSGVTSSIQTQINNSGGYSSIYTVSIAANTTFTKTPADFGMTANGIYEMIWTATGLTLDLVYATFRVKISSGNITQYDQSVSVLQEMTEEVYWASPGYFSFPSRTYARTYKFVWKYLCNL